MICNSMSHFGYEVSSAKASDEKCGDPGKLHVLHGLKQKFDAQGLTIQRCFYNNQSNSYDTNGKYSTIRKFIRRLHNAGFNFWFIFLKAKRSQIAQNWLKRASFVSSLVSSSGVSAMCRPLNFGQKRVFSLETCFFLHKHSIWPGTGIG